MHYVNKAFPDMASLLDYAQGPCDWPARERSSVNGKDKASAGASREQADALARFGWIEGAERLHKAIIAPPGRAPRRVWRNDCPGETLDVTAFVSRSAPPFLDRQKRSRGRKVVNVTVPGCYPWSIPAADVEAYFAGLCSLVVALQEQGVRVGLTVEWSTRVDDETWTVSAVVKRPEESLQPASIAFAVAHAAALRRIVFAAYEVATPWAKAQKGFRTFYGYPTTTTLPGSIAAPACRAETVRDCKASPVQYWEEWWRKASATGEV